MNWGKCLAVCMAILGLSACQEQTADFAGYIEARYIAIAAPSGGKLMSAVPEGQKIHRGDVLFSVDDAPQKWALTQAKAQVAQATAVWRNLQSGVRSDKLAALDARLQAAQADATYTKKEWHRHQKLLAEGAVSASNVDALRRQYQSAKANVDAIQAEIREANLGARNEEIQAALASLQAAQAQEAQAQWQWEEQTQSSPIDGQVYRLIYQPGEYIPPGRTVLQLLNPKQRKVYFFVNQSYLNALHIGQTVEVYWDAPERLPEKTARATAHVDYIADVAEYTPPVIFSNQTRDNLVYLIKATLEENPSALPQFGQPVSVRLP